MVKAKRISRLIDSFFDKLLYIPVAMIIMLLGICTITVALRKIFTGAFYWSDEAMRFLMVYASFLALPYMTSEKKNITIDLTDALFSKDSKGKWTFYLLCEILTCIGCAVLMPACITYITANVNGRSSAMHLPLALVYSCLPIGFFLSIVASLNNIFQLFTFTKEDRS